MNLRLQLSIAVLTAVSFVACQPQTPQEPKNDSIDLLLSRMTLEEKVGEMTQMTIWPLLEMGEEGLIEPQRGDSAKLYHALVELHIGNLINVESYDYTVDQWSELHALIDKIDDLKPNKIPVLYGIDANHGANYTKNAILFPQQIGQAATWDTVATKRIGEITALETRISGIPWAFSPVLDVARDPRWPRMWETYGESTVLASWMGQAATKGMQGKGDVIDGNHVAVSLKHFLGYSASNTGKDRTQAWIPERQLRQYYVPTFQAAIDAGAKTVMINSGDVNGVPVHASPEILIDLLRKDMGFEGVTVTDWADIKYLFQRHRIAANYKEAVAIAINSGIDMSMVPDDFEFPGLLVECVNEGLVSMERIDEAVGRILKLKQDLGLFEEDMERPNPELFNSSENRDFALKSAENSLVLLKNDGILPFSDQKLLVTGPTANSLIPLNGGWSHSWQGTNPALENRGIVPTVAEALMARGAQYLSSGEDVENYTSNAQLLSAAKRSDVVVVAFGEWAYCEGVGDLEDLRIHESQRALIKELAAQGATLVGVITAGRPRVIKEVEDYFSALIFAPLPGDFGGQAIANVLYGDHNPSGKLPFTYPRNPSVHITFDHRPADAMSIAAGPSSYDGRPAFGPQYEFGHGLSYTTYAVSAELLNDQVEEELKVRVLVENTGDRAGRETVPVYYEDLVASIVPSVKNLCAYVQVDLQPGERKEVVLTIPRSQFAFVGLENQWVTEPGAMKLKIADQVFDFTLL